MRPASFRTPRRPHSGFFFQSGSGSLAGEEAGLITSSMSGFYGEATRLEATDQGTSSAASWSRTTRLEATDQGTSFVVSWSWIPYVSECPGSIIYEVCMRSWEHGRAVESERIVYAGPDARCRIDGLAPSSFYEMRFDAVNQHGQRSSGAHNHIATPCAALGTTNVRECVCVCTRPQSNSASGLKLLVYAAFSFYCMISMFP